MPSVFLSHSSADKPLIRKLATPARHYPSGRSVEGVDDLLGNVWDWCHDWFASYSGESVENAVGGKIDELKVVRGGSWDDISKFVRVSNRSRYVPTLRLNIIGFRCAADA